MTAFLPRCCPGEGLPEGVSLDKSEITRYSRNILLEEVGRAGQERLKEARVLVVGAGGLGSPVLLYLAAGGVGHLTIVESDRLDLTNLQRQILYQTDEIGSFKAELARQRLGALNPHLDIRVIGQRLTPENGRGVFQDFDLVIDGSDNFPTRFLVNDLCLYAGLPLLSGGILRFHGLVLGILPGRTPCYRCIFEHPPAPGSVPSCSAAGVLGAAAGVVGSVMASEAIKYLLGIGSSVFGQLLRVDLLDLEFRLTPAPATEDCPLCRERKGGRTLNFDPSHPDYRGIECAPPFSLDS